MLVVFIFDIAPPIVKLSVISASSLEYKCSAQTYPLPLISPETVTLSAKLPPPLEDIYPYL